MRKVTWDENTVLAVKLRDDLFTLVQMRKNHLMLRNVRNAGRSEKVQGALLRYFDTGVNWDVSKKFIFKGNQPPPPHQEPA